MAAPRRSVGLFRFLSGRRTAWAVLGVAVAASAGVLWLDPGAGSAPTAGSTLPASAESARAGLRQARLPSGTIDAALLVFSRNGTPLTESDRRVVINQAEAARAVAFGGKAPGPVFARDGKAAIVSVPLDAKAGDERTVESVQRLRDSLTAAQAGAPGLVTQLSGGPGFTYDVAKSFDGASASLLLVTVAVVALLLLVTYRSPWLWLVPLAVIGVADRVTTALLDVLAKAFDLPVDPATAGIVSVLVFGAGTNYALLLIARYRDELRREPDRHVAMQRALSSGVPAIAASASTVVLSLLTLLLASLSDNRALGMAGALGIGVALSYAVLVLPAALSVCGRGLFWPFVPRAGQSNPALSGGWSRVGAAVARRPRQVIAASLGVLGLLATGLIGLRVGLAPTEQFRGRPDSVAGQEVLARHFPAGAADPVAVLTDADSASRVATLARTLPGVSGATIGQRTRDGSIVEVDVVLDAASGSAASDATLRLLRSRLDTADPDVLVGGSLATDYDTRQASARDSKVVIPAVLAVVFVVLGLLLRSLVAPVLLVLTVVGSFFAALGASWFAFDAWFGYDGLDLGVPLLAFLFLVALGVDYNIFLTTRAREEALRLGTRRGVVTALALTGGVITSAGILLASVFAVLGVLPVITLTQLGVIVGFGVLLDTLLVRSVLVPALVLVVGRSFWWPSRLGRGGTAPTPATAIALRRRAVNAMERSAGGQHWHTDFDLASPPEEGTS